MVSDETRDLILGQLFRILPSGTVIIRKNTTDEFIRWSNISFEDRHTALKRDYKNGVRGFLRTFYLLASNDFHHCRFMRKHHKILASKD